MTRLPIVRFDSDGSVIDGTADWDGAGLGDFRDLDGVSLPLPVGSAYQFALSDADVSPQMLAMMRHASLAVMVAISKRRVRYRIDISNGSEMLGRRILGVRRLGWGAWTAKGARRKADRIVLGMHPEGQFFGSVTFSTEEQ